MGNGFGDKLARGAVSASYATTDNKKITDEQWKAMFEGFDPKEFLREASNETSRGDANIPPSGNVSIEPREAAASK